MKRLWIEIQRLYESEHLTQKQSHKQHIMNQDNLEQCYRDWITICKGKRIEVKLYVLVFPCIFHTIYSSIILAVIATSIPCSSLAPVPAKVSRSPPEISPTEASSVELWNRKNMCKTYMNIYYEL